MAMNAATNQEPLTVADICKAISTHELPAEKRGPWYVVRRRDILTLATKMASQRRFAEPKMAS